MDSDAPPVLPAPTPQPVPPAPRKSRSVLYVVLGMVAAVILGVLFVVGSGTVFMLTAKDEPLSSDDRAALLTASQIAEWIDDFSPDVSKETFSKTRFLDRSYDLDYEFEDPHNADAPYVSSSVTVEPKASDARISYKALQTGLDIGFGSQSGTVQVERNDLFRWGDSSKFCVLEIDGTPFGNTFTAVKGKHVYMMTISGVYFDDPAVIQQLLRPRLDALERLPAP